MYPQFQNAVGTLLISASLNLCGNDSIGLAGKSVPLWVYVFLVIVTRYFSRSGCTLQPRCLSEEFTQSMTDCYSICAYM